MKKLLSALVLSTIMFNVHAEKPFWMLIDKPAPGISVYLDLVTFGNKKIDDHKMAFGAILFSSVEPQTIEFEGKKYENLHGKVKLVLVNCDTGMSQVKDDYYYYDSIPGKYDGADLHVKHPDDEEIKKLAPKYLKALCPDEKDDT